MKRTIVETPLEIKALGKFFTETEEQVERLKRPANIYQYNVE